MFACAIILFRISKLGSSAETERLVGSVHKAVQILSAMDESVVARRSIEIINHHLREIRGSISDTTGNVAIHDQLYSTILPADASDTLLPVSLHIFLSCEMEPNSYFRSYPTDSDYPSIRSKKWPGSLTTSATSQ